MLLSERVRRAADKAGGVPTLAKKTRIGRQTLYDIIEKAHIPSGRTLLRLLSGGVIKHCDLSDLDKAA